MKRVMFVNGLLAIMLMFALCTLPGCGEKEQTQSKSETVSKEDFMEKAQDAYNTTKVYTKEQVQAFQEQTETKHTEYEDEIDQLQAMAEKLEGAGKAKAEQRVMALRQKRDEVSGKLKDLSSSSGHALEQPKTGIDAAMEDLGNAFKNAVAEFSKS